MEQKSGTKISRRTALKQLSYLACVVPVSIAGMASPAIAESKASKEASKYQDKPNGNQNCGNCAYILSDQKSCKIVEGDIRPEGWCKFWRAKGA